MFFAGEEDSLWSSSTHHKNQNVGQSEFLEFCKPHSKTLCFFAGMPEWSNGAGLGPVSLVLTGVRILVPAFF